MEPEHTSEFEILLIPTVILPAHPSMRERPLSFHLRHCCGQRLLGGPV